LREDRQISVEDIFTLAYQDGWRVNGGRAHGWTEQWVERGGSLPVFEFGATPQALAAGTAQLGEVKVEAIHTGFSRVVTVGELDLNRNKTYRVAIARAIEPAELTVFLKGDAAGVATLQRSLAEMDARLVRRRSRSPSSAAVVVLKRSSLTQRKN